MSLVPARIAHLVIDELAASPHIILQAIDSEKRLLIEIGMHEALAISYALNQQAFPRPLSHDLMRCLIDALHGVLEAVEIHSCNNETYLADLLIRQGERLLRIDARPSDSLALAVRCSASLFIAEELFDG